jgi:hypothetical protein
MKDGAEYLERLITGHVLLHGIFQLLLQLSLHRVAAAEKVVHAALRCHAGQAAQAAKCKQAAVDNAKDSGGGDRARTLRRHG